MLLLSPLLGEAILMPQGAGPPGDLGPGEQGEGVAAAAGAAPHPPRPVGCERRWQDGRLWSWGNAIGPEVPGDWTPGKIIIFSGRSSTRITDLGLTVSSTPA